MIKQETQWLQELSKLIENKEYEKAIECLTNKYELIFSSPSLHQMYRLTSQIPNEFFINSFSKLLFGWLCFACGDNKRVSWVLNTLNETDLNTPEESSCYYGLKALTSVGDSQSEGLRYAKLSVDVLPKENTSFIAGNAHMTYGQSLASINRYRDATEYFAKGFKIFSQKGISFLAINCFVNECLNLYALGYCRQVIEKCQKILVMNSSKDTKMTSYLNIVKLPMGMCYYELNKVSMSIDALESVKSAVSELKLVHMHGLIEWCLFQSYRERNDHQSMMNQIKSLECVYKNLNYPSVSCFIAAMKCIHALTVNTKPNKEWVEELELAYELNPKVMIRYLLGVLTELSLKGYTQIITEEILIKQLEELRFIGNIPEIQSISLYLAEIFLNKGNLNAMKVHLKAAYDIYKEYGLIIQFVSKSLKSFAYIEELDPSLSGQLIKTKIERRPDEDITNFLKETLTNREQEILCLIAQGKSNREVAEELFISIGTIKWHINNIFGKLQVKKRFDAVSKAKELNLV